jgi:hypothetical protein
MKSLLLRFVESFGCFLSKIGNSVENWAFSQNPRLQQIQKELNGKRAYSVDDIQTSFGKERDELIVFHQKITEDEKEKGYIKMWIEDVLRDYDALICKHNGFVPLDFSSRRVPTKALAEESREVEVNILHCFPAECKRDFIIHHVAEMIKHIQETHYPNTPIWIEITQHKEVKK